MCHTVLQYFLVYYVVYTKLHYIVLYYTVRMFQCDVMMGFTAVCYAMDYFGVT